jgi:hypothetical protein
LGHAIERSATVIGTIAWTIIALSGMVFIAVITVIVLSLTSGVDGQGD